MATVLENYRIAVRAAKPLARMTVVTSEDGHRFYQIMDGDNALTGEEVSPTIAWREADYRLCNLSETDHARLERFVLARNGHRSAVRAAEGFVSGQRVYALKAAQRRLTAAIWELADYLEDHARAELCLPPTPVCLASKGSSI
jgi:hypothetical protein